jgi:small subunit ribosomal protein S18
MAYFKKPKRTESTRPRVRYTGPRKPSYLEEHQIAYVDYKDVKVLQRFTSPQGRILPRRVTRLTNIQQHAVTAAIKRARHLALIPYVTDQEAY